MGSAFLSGDTALLKDRNAQMNRVCLWRSEIKPDYIISEADESLRMLQRSVLRVLPVYLAPPNI